MSSTTWWKRLRSNRAPRRRRARSRPSSQTRSPTLYEIAWPGHAQVAVDFGGEELAPDGRCARAGTASPVSDLHISPGWNCSSVGNSHLAMQSDVEDHSRCAQRLTRQPSELVHRIVEVSELVHQSLGIQRPPLAVARDGDAEPLETGQRIGLVHHLRQLEMMARSTLVVLGRQGLPQREAFLPGDLMPDLTRPGEVLARWRVVRGLGSPGGSRHRLASAQRIGDLEVPAVEIVDGPVDHVLAPCQEVVGALDDVTRIALQLVDAVVSRSTRDDPLDQRRHARLDVAELFPAPCVGLVQIEIGAVVKADEQPVAVRAHRVVGCRDGRVVGAQPSAELVKAAAAAAASVDRSNDGHSAASSPKNPSGLPQTRTLRRARQRLAPRRELVVAGGVHEAGAQLVERRWHLGQPGPHAAPILFRFAWHVVEDVADVGVVAVQHAEPSVVLAGVDQIELCLHSLAHDFDGDAIASTAWLDRATVHRSSVVAGRAATPNHRASSRSSPRRDRVCPRRMRASDRAPRSRRCTGPTARRSRARRGDPPRTRSASPSSHHAASAPLAVKILAG